MAETSFRATWINFILIGILVFSLISFIVVFQEQNNVEGGILENELINSTFNDLAEELSTSGGDVQTQRESFEAEIPERGFGSLIIFTIVGVTQNFMSVIITIFNILIVLPAQIIGVSPIVISALGSILIVSLILLAWRVYRIGS